MPITNKEDDDKPGLYDHNKPVRPAHISSVLYYPEFTEDDDVAHYLAQAEWHFSGSVQDLSVTMAVEQAEIPGSEVVSFSADPARDLAQTHDLILFWQADAYWKAAPYLRRKGIIVDDFSEAAVCDKLAQEVSELRRPDFATHKAGFSAYVRKNETGLRPVLLIGSGPELGTIPDSALEQISPATNIYMGTALLDQRATHIRPPDIVIAADGPSQFGWSETAERFRAHLFFHMREHGTHLVAPSNFGPIIEAHWPIDCAEKVWLVPPSDLLPGDHNLSEGWNFQPSSNVLTSLAIPCAAALSDTIMFLGVSSEKPENMNGGGGPDPITFYHVSETDYQRHIADLLAHHPASIVDRTSYIDEHYRRLHDQILALSKKGKLFRHIDGTAISFDETEEAELRQPNQLTVRFFGLISKLQNNPYHILAFIFLLSGGLGAALEYYIGIHMTGFILAGAIGVGGLVILLFIRMRMNRMLTNLERRLSKQQAAQFKNLSDRLASMERDQDP